MADQPKTDMVMKFVPRRPAGPLFSECRLDKDPKDPFMKEFTPAPSEDAYSDFFQITKFDFGLEMKEEDKSKEKLSASGSAIPTTQKPFDMAKAMVKGSFVSWRSATDAEIKQGKIKYPVEFETFSFSRIIDAASPIFFESCLNSRTFDSATLVKRVAADNSQYPQSFLQIKFTDVLIIGLDWDDGGLVTENCKFICRGFKLQYRAQGESGVLQGPISADWVPSRDSLPETR